MVTPSMMGLSNLSFHLNYFHYVLGVPMEVMGLMVSIPIFLYALALEIMTRLSKHYEKMLHDIIIFNFLAWRVRR